MLLAKLGEGLAVALSTPVTRIAWSGRDVAVETAGGSHQRAGRHRHGVEQRADLGRLPFAPELPKRQLDAAAKLSLGSYDRIALQLPGNPLGLGRDEVVIERSKR